MRYWLALKSLALVAGVLVTAIAMKVHTMDRPHFGLVLIVLWTVSPYALFFLVTALTERFSSHRKVAVVSAIVALLMLAFTIWTYTGMNGESSTEGLVFLFGPLYLHVGSLILFGIGLSFSIQFGKGIDKNRS